MPATCKRPHTPLLDHPPWDTPSWSHLVLPQSVPVSLCGPNSVSSYTLIQQMCPQHLPHAVCGTGPEPWLSLMHSVFCHLHFCLSFPLPFVLSCSTTRWCRQEGECPGLNYTKRYVEAPTLVSVRMTLFEDEVLTDVSTLSSYLIG